MKTCLMGVCLLLTFSFLFTACALSANKDVNEEKNKEIGVENMKALMIIARKDYQDIEYNNTKNVLEKEGIEVIVASNRTGTCRGVLGGTAQAEISLSGVDVSEYDAVIFIGGPGAASFQHDAEAHLTAQEAVTMNKVLGAICIAPTILAYGGVLEGKKATVWDGDGKQHEILEKNGAVFTNKTVTVDGKIVTANGPPAAREFGKKIVELLKQK